MPLSKEVELAVFERDKNTCQGCHQVFPTKFEVKVPDALNFYRSGQSIGGRYENFLVVDHVNGRSDEMDNLQALCWSCNSSKAGRSDNSFKLSVALKNLGHPVVYYPSLAKLVGLKESIFLCQLIYWTPRGRHDKGDGWIYKAAEEMDEETGLSYKEQIRIRRKLSKMNLLQEYYDRKEHVLYFRVNVQQLDQVGQELNGEHMTNGHMPNRQKAPAQKSDGTCPKVSSYKEAKITPKNTPKTTKPKFEIEREQIARILSEKVQ